MPTRVYKITADHLKGKADVLDEIIQDEPTLLTKYVLAALYEVGAANAERLEAIDASLNSIAVSLKSSAVSNKAREPKY